MKLSKFASLPTIRRLPSYLHVIEAAQRAGRAFISGTVIAEELELESIQVRKDLSVTGIVGKPRVGYPVPELLRAITGFLDWNRNHYAAIIGAGHLASALAGYAEFSRHGLRIVAAFDVHPDKIGGKINAVPIYPLAEFGSQSAHLGIDIAILTVPSSEAQAVTDEIVAHGVRAIWNFTNVKIKVPDHVIVQKEDLSSGYAVLSVKTGILRDAER